MPWDEALPMAQKYVKGTDITRAQGQETTRNINAFSSQP